MNVSENNSNKANYLNRIEPIEDTPFFIVFQDNTWFVTFSNYKMTESQTVHPDYKISEDNIPYFKEQALELLESQKWMITMRICGITHEKIAQMAVEHMNQPPNQPVVVPQSKTDD